MWTMSRKPRVVIIPTGDASAGASGQMSNLNDRFDRIERRIDALATKDTTGTVPTEDEGPRPAANPSSQEEQGE